MSPPLPHESFRVVREVRLPATNDLILPWYIYPDGRQWYTLYKGYTPGYLDIRISTNSASGVKSSIGYNFGTTYIGNDTNTLSTMNSYGEINFGGINTSPVTTSTPPVFFTPITSVNLIDKLILTRLQLVQLINNLKNGPYNSVRNTPYAYLDSNGNTHLGCLTIIKNPSNGQTLQYFNETAVGSDSYVKLPLKNGQELYPCNNSSSGYSYDNGIVTVTNWDGTNNQPAMHDPNKVMLFHEESGTWLIVTPDVRPALPTNNPFIPAYYNAIPRITKSIVDTGPNSDFQKAQLLFQNNSLTLAEALFVKREYFDVSIPDLKGGIDVYMQQLIDKVRFGLADEFKASAEEIFVRYATAELVVLDANLATLNTADPKQKANFSNMTNVINVLENKNWINYWNIHNCNTAAKLQNAASGLPNSTPVGAGSQANTFIDKKRQTQSGMTTPDIDMQKAVDIVIKNLKEGKPVMAGVMYERQIGADKIEGGSQGDNNNVATNHYITIVGMGIDNNGNPYFSYYDNFVDPYLPDGITPKSQSAMQLYAKDTLANRIYYYKDSVGNYYFADPKATTLEGSHGSNLEYILTEVRDNF